MYGAGAIAGGVVGGVVGLALVVVLVLYLRHRRPRWLVGKKSLGAGGGENQAAAQYTPVSPIPFLKI
jgi:hypothetical protein